MPLTESQLIERKKHMGASDVAAILGLDPHRSAFDTWAEKTGRLDDKDDSAKKWLATGNRFESAMIDWAEILLGPIARDANVSDPAGSILLAHPDGLVVSTGNPVEAKTAGLYGPLQEHWGEEGSDDVPLRVVVQAEVQMLCTLKLVCHIPAFVQGRGELMFEIPFDAQLANNLRDKAQEFWTKHVLADTPPDAVPSVETIKKLRREPKSVVSLTDQVVDAWIAAREARLAAEKQEKATWMAVGQELGTAEAGRFSGGLLTYYEQERKAYSVEASSFRVARVKKG
jgi:putative phage-type endonuclease